MIIAASASGAERQLFGFAAPARAPPACASIVDVAETIAGVGVAA